MWLQQIQLSGHRDESLQHQLRRALVTTILDDEIPHDHPLPSSRRLARKLGVARNTVVSAYQQLKNEGYLLTEERRGYFVNSKLVYSRTSCAPKHVSASAGSPNWEERISNKPSRQRILDAEPDQYRQYQYPFTTAQVSPELFPMKEWRECSRQSLAVQDITRWIHDYVDNDDQLLVREIQNRVLPRRGLWVSTDQILITVGVQNALYLLARLLVNKGDNVGFENPGSPDARNIFEFRDCNLTPLDVDENGMVVDDRISLCDVVYCTPSCQSPTTVTMSLERREKLLQRAAEDDFLIIEDDYEGDLNFTGTEIPALRSLDGNERVIYVGSLSKTLAPGLRLGYMVAQKELIDEARALRRLMFRHPSSNNQNAVAHFLSRGYHELLVRRLAAEYKERWRALDNALQEYMPDFGQTPSFGEVLSG